MVDLGFLSTGKKEKSIFDGILRLLDTVVEAVDFFESSVASLGQGDAWACRCPGVRLLLDACLVTLLRTHSIPTRGSAYSSFIRNTIP